MNAQETLQLRYGVSAEGNFRIIDTIGVPHAYCITPIHVGVAADHHCGILNESAIKDAEERGAKCGVRGCKRSYAEHETALLVSCLLELKDDHGKLNPELRQYLLSCNDRCQADGHAGYAFIKDPVVDSIDEE
jgi:hypothetical protein